MNATQKIDLIDSVLLRRWHCRNATLGITVISLLLYCGRINASILFTQPTAPIHAGIFPDEPAAEIDLDANGITDLIIPGSFRQIDVFPQRSNQIISIFDVGSFFAVGLDEGSFIGTIPEAGTEWQADSPVMAACANAGGVVCFGQFLGGINYLGVEFDIAGDTHYGWLEISSSDGAPIIDVLSWAYETEPGVGILAGAIPEPSAAVLAISATLLILRRKRKCSTC